MKKLLSVLAASVLALTMVGTSVSAKEVKKEPKVKYEQEFHVGEKPLKSFKDPNTGVVVDVYESFENEPTTGFTTLTTGVTALSSGWDLVGTDWWTMNGNPNDWRQDLTVYSTGGDFMFRVPAHKGYGGTDAHVKLKELDSGAETHFTVASWTIHPQTVSYDYIVRDINWWVDGANNKAEFYTYHASDYYVSGNILENVRYYD